ncbi:MAG TPA: TlpA disulfide reductase family protein [Pyrinomonadaceae bacterium]|jgi:thiol-disulfide isomerase/thioredoxin
MVNIVFLLQLPIYHLPFTFYESIFMKVFALTFFTFAIFLSAACRPAAAPVSISNKPSSINDVPQKGVPFPPSKPVGEMSWTIFEGKTNRDASRQKLKDLNGKVVVLDFWATYCPPCIEEIPHLRELQAKYGAENLAVIGLHVGGEDDRPQVPRFVERLNIDYALATPENALITFIFGGEDSIPQTAVFDRGGKLVDKFVGFDETVKSRLDQAIESAVRQ